jgi:hypothetical protein
MRIAADLLHDFSPNLALGAALALLKADWVLLPEAIRLLILPDQQDPLLI